MMLSVQLSNLIRVQLNTIVTGIPNVVSVPCIYLGARAHYYVHRFLISTWKRWPHRVWFPPEGWMQFASSHSLFLIKLLCSSLIGILESNKLYPMMWPDCACLHGRVFPGKLVVESKLCTSWLVSLMHVLLTCPWARAIALWPLAYSKHPSK